MGAARLLAKGWVAFCLFTGAHALAHALAGFRPPEQALPAAGICVALFGAMGLLFIAGFGATARGGGLSRLSLRYFVPGFNDLVFVLFAVIVFVVQIHFAPGQGPGGALGALEAAVRFAVPGQRALEDTLLGYTLDGGRAFASAASWLLAFVFLGSALSRIRMGAALMRLERKQHGEVLGAAVFTFLVSLLGIQLLAMGMLYPLIPKDMLSSLPGAVLIGLGPLALAYVIVAAITNLLALNPEA
jgi:hypothetical protein